MSKDENIGDNKNIEEIQNGTLEVIGLSDLEDVLKKDSPIAYTGYEPSGKVHLGHAITINKLIQLQKMGFKIKILLADFHAFLNGKGTLEEISEVAEYNKKCFQALGLSEDTEFILGSKFQLDEEYTTNLYKLSLLTTLVRAKRSMDQVSRFDENPKVASVVYPLMQVADMLALEVDIALGGMEQRKIQMLARENLPKLGIESPICIHTPLLHGLDGDAKMSSSKENYIAIDDSEKEIKDKIKKSYCPIKEIDGNPIIELANYFVFPQQQTLLIKRPEKFGGNLKLTQEELIKKYEYGELHPLDLKNAITDYIIEYLAPVRQYMEK
ncbi:MAG: tyrosine--tRNA ligase [Methanobacteriaceae archaeon]